MPTPSSILAADIDAALAEGPGGLARAALLVGRVEAPALPLEHCLATLADLGARASALLRDGAYTTTASRVRALNQFLYQTEGFRGNQAHYDDLRNSLLHVVLERRLGIPITLAVTYVDVARQAGIEVLGITFPGHFLLRVPADAGDDEGTLILDPFDGGRTLTRTAIRALLAQHAGSDAEFSERLLAPCTSRQIVVRMLNNLKRLYVAGRSFAQAWMVTDLLVTIAGGQPEDVRDRGLLAYHLDDFRAALHDLETYLQTQGPAHEESQERRQIWDHVSALRRRVASMN